MKRNHFLIVAALVPWLFGAVMMFVPDLMLSNSLATEFEAPTGIVTQWVGFGVFSLGWINFLSRNDGGSPALRAVIVGNILFHTLGIGFDTYHHQIGFMTTSGLISGLVPHAILAIGFLYYLLDVRKGDATSSRRAGVF